MNIRLQSFSWALALASLVLTANALAAAAQAVPELVRAADDVRIEFDVRGQGETALVFIHGWCSDRHSWEHQLEALAGDYRVVVLDLAGHGRSGRDRKTWTVAGFAADVEAVVQKLDLKRVILVGHSMGGPIALATARRPPGVVVGVIGVDTLQNAEYKFPEDQRQGYLAAFEKDFGGTMAIGLAGMLPEGADPKLRERLIATAMSTDRTMALATMRDIGQINEKTLLQEAKVPVRCINSGGGFTFHVPTAVETQRKYADYAAVLIDNVGHYPMLEKPEEFNAKLREVLKEFAGGPKK
jgi:pimeloyl-ACP methyl ester carboxylesterase